MVVSLIDYCGLDVSNELVVKPVLRVTRCLRSLKVAAEGNDFAGLGGQGFL